MGLKEILLSSEKLKNKFIPQGDNLTQFIRALSYLIHEDLKMVYHMGAQGQITQLVLDIVINSGTFESEKKYKISKEEANLDYLYIYLPNKPGFLLERTVENTLIMRRATKTSSQVTNQFGQPQYNVLFVALRPDIEEFILLDEKTLRSSNGKTLSVEQTSEMLLSVAINSLED